MDFTVILYMNKMYKTLKVFNIIEYLLLFKKC